MMNHAQRLRHSIAILSLSILFMFLLSLSIQLVLGPIIQSASPALYHHPIFQWVLGSIPLYGIAMPLALPLIKRAAPASPPRRRRLSPIAWIGALSACFLSSYLLSIAGALISRLLANLTGAPYQNPVESMTVVSPLWCNLLFLVILAPVFEEIFLRKLIIDRLRPYGELAAILLSGIAFGLVHGNLHQLLYACASGILFGWIYVKTGNIVVNISLHATLNFIGGVYASEIEKLTRGNDWNGLLQNPAALADVLNIVYAVLLGVCALVCIILLARIKAWAPLVRLNAAELPLTRRDWRVALWTNHFVWFFLVFFVLLLFI